MKTPVPTMLAITRTVAEKRLTGLLPSGVPSISPSAPEFPCTTVFMRDTHTREEGTQASRMPSFTTIRNNILFYREVHFMNSRAT